MSYDSLFAVVVVVSVSIIVIIGVFSKSNKMKKILKQENEVLKKSSEGDEDLPDPDLVEKAVNEEEGDVNKTKAPVNRLYGVSVNVDTDVE